ncbi:MAG: c-type cytochrome biogenesis protein CcmI [Candidatus Binatus sp.]|uniref:c-type cytochrome biogenesis protein CcmI n=1 Tax=Candidatus Binatus sp. TaxID=2811406 RepID=UPI003BB02302
MFILAAALIVAGVALFVAAPLGIGLVGARAKSAGELQVERHEHERALAVQGLRELEFDREMGKLSNADYESMHKALEDRALTAMAAVENIRVQADNAANAKKPSVTPLAPRKSAPALRRIDPIPTLVVHAEPPRPPQPAPQSSQSRKISFCPQCGMRAAIDSKFCAQCGIAIKPMGAAIARSE